MANKYHHFSLDDIQNMIMDTALTVMKDPLFVQRKDNPFTDDVKSQNERIAMFNEGVRDMAMTLIQVITETAEDEEKQEAEARKEREELLRKQKEAAESDEH